MSFMSGVADELLMARPCAHTKAQAGKRSAARVKAREDVAGFAPSCGTCFVCCDSPSLLLEVCVRMWVVHSTQCKP